MADSPAPETDSAASQSEESSPSRPSRPAVSGELGLMFAPIIGSFKDFFRPDHPQHQQRLIGTWVAAGLLVVGIGWGLYQGTSAQANEVTWANWIGVPTEVNKAMIRSLDEGDVLTGVSDLREKVYTNFLNKNEDADPEVRSWARLLRAETRLRLSLQRGYRSDRSANRRKGAQRILSTSIADITKAKDDFKSVRDNSPEGSELRQRALFGLAVVAEATCEGTPESIDKAVAAYRKLEATDGPYKELARNRRESLQHPDAAEFYKWFFLVSETPTPLATSPLGAAGTGTAGDPFPPGLLESLTGGNPGAPDPKSQPDTKDKDIRKIPDSLPLPGKKPAEKKPAEKKPAAKKPAEKKPAEKKPAAKKPAAKKPAAKKPAAKKPAAKKKPATKKKLGE